MPDASRRSAAAARMLAVAAAAALGAGGFTAESVPTITTPATPSAKTLVILGTVTDIRPQAASLSRRDWAITVHVDKVTVGEFSASTLTFRVHSPTRAGLVVGHAYSIKATWNGEGYDVDETQWRTPGASRANGAGLESRPGD